MSRVWTEQEVDALRKVMSTELLLRVVEGRKNVAVAAVAEMSATKRAGVLRELLDVVEGVYVRVPALRDALEDMYGEYLITAWPLEVVEKIMEERGDIPPEYRQ